MGRVISKPAAAPALTPLEKYLMYRSIQTDINTRVVNEHIDEDRLNAAARLLGLEIRKNTIDVNKYDLPALYDFAINDLRRGGRTALENYVEETGGVEGAQGAARRSLLKAMLSAGTSLYRTGRADPEAGTVEMEDVLGGGGTVTIHDRGLSRSSRAGIGIFTRIVSMPEISMGAGAAALFKPRRLQRAASDYRRLEARSNRRPEVKRYAIFFRLYRRYGTQSRYGDSRTGLPE